MSNAAKTRYSALDTLRALCLISMILYHATWDLVYMFGVKAPWYSSSIGFLWQQSICFGFILLSGFCFDIGKRKLNRALTVLFCSVVISAVTHFIPGAEIRFGVLCLIGSAMLIMIPLEKLLCHVCAPVGLSVSLSLFAFTKNIDAGYLGVFSYKLIELPRSLYSSLFSAYLGLPPRTFSSADYFGLLPWLFLYICGYFIYRIMKERKALGILYRLKCPPLESVGRHSLLLYMAHQPIIYGILYIFFEII